MTASARRKSQRANRCPRGPAGRVPANQVTKLGVQRFTETDDSARAISWRRAPRECAQNTSHPRRASGSSGSGCGRSKNKFLPPANERQEPEQSTQPDSSQEAGVPCAPRPPPRSTSGPARRLPASNAWRRHGRFAGIALASTDHVGLEIQCDDRHRTVALAQHWRDKGCMHRRIEP